MKTDKEMHLKKKTIQLSGISEFTFFFKFMWKNFAFKITTSLHLDRQNMLYITNSKWSMFIYLSVDEMVTK